MINYLGMLGNPLQQQSTSTVSPAQWGQALGGMKQQAEQQQIQQAQLAEAQQALESGDPSSVANLMLTNPELAKQVQGGLQFKSDATRQNLISSIEEVLANPNNAEQILTDRINLVESQGGDASQSRSALAELKADPKGFFKNAEVLYAIQAPEKSEAYQKAKLAGMPPTPEYTGSPQYDEAGNPYMFNKTTGKFEPVGGGFVKGEAKPQTVVNVGKAEGEQAKTIAKAEGENYNAYVKDAKSARQNDITLNQLEKLNESAFSGVTAPAYKSAAKLAKSIGIEVEGLTETELFDSLSNQLVLGQTSKLTGVLTDKDMDLLASTVPQLSQTKEGRKKLIQIMKEVNVATREKAKLAAQFRKENNGQFDDMTFQEWLEDRPKKDRFTSIIGEQQPKRVQAPQSAIDYLMANPNLKESFKAKYGYLPEGM